MEIESRKPQENVEQENDILGSFKFEKGNDKEKKARNAVRRKAKTEEYTQALQERGEESENTEMVVEAKKREPSEKRTRKQKVTPSNSTADEDENEMPPPKANSSQK